MAEANGCSDFCSAANKISNTPVSAESSQCTSVTTGTPSVNVPVLSNTIVFTLQRCSKAKASFIKICRSAAFPMPTMSAVGVANPSAHGQAITKTDTAESNA